MIIFALHLHSDSLHVNTYIPTGSLFPHLLAEDFVPIGPLNTNELRCKTLLIFSKDDGGG